MNLWIASVALVIPASLRGAGAFIAGTLSGRAEDGVPDFFSVPLYGEDKETPSHYLAHTRVRRDVLERLEGLSQALPGSAWCLTQHDDPDVSTMTVEAFLMSQGLELNPSQ